MTRRNAFVFYTDCARLCIAIGDHASARAYLTLASQASRGTLAA